MDTLKQEPARILSPVSLQYANTRLDYSGKAYTQLAWNDTLPCMNDA
jgi:hypothetical protein